MAKQTLEALLAWAKRKRVAIDIGYDGSVFAKKWIGGSLTCAQGRTLREALVAVQRKLGK